MKTYNPKTLDEAIDWVMSVIHPDDLVEIKKRLNSGEDIDNIAGQSHHGFGTFVRNTLQLWHPPSEELRLQIWNSLKPEQQKFYADWWAGKGDHKGRTMHADDASHELITLAMLKIKG